MTDALQVCRKRLILLKCFPDIVNIVAFVIFQLEFHTMLKSDSTYLEMLVPNKIIRYRHANTDKQIHTN